MHPQPSTPCRDCSKVPLHGYPSSINTARLEVLLLDVGPYMEPHPAIVTLRDSEDYVRVLYSEYTRNTPNPKPIFLVYPLFQGEGSSEVRPQTLAC